jgi:hypothetical protein
MQLFSLIFCRNKKQFSWMSGSVHYSMQVFQLLEGKSQLLNKTGKRVIPSEAGLLTKYMLSNIKSRLRCSKTDRNMLVLVWE